LRLDRLTHEESQMASAELLKITHKIEGTVQDIHGNVQDVSHNVQKVDDRVRGIGNDVEGIFNEVRNVDDKLDQVNCLYLSTSARHPEDRDSFTVNQLRDSLFRWLSPPDPSVNHNIACKAHHDGASQWFFQGSVFNQWKSTDPFLWIHGKRASLLAFTMR
jgi:hypothetical protein